MDPYLNMGTSASCAVDEKSEEWAENVQSQGKFARLVPPRAPVFMCKS